MEAENNVDMVLDGYIHSKCSDPLLVVGNMITKYASDLIEKYGHDKRVRFMGGIYNQNDLNNLRYFAKYYFHGHSVGGTNPSLLEAMASSVYIVAHGNEFNKAVLGDDGSFFLNRDEVTRFVDNFKKDQKVPAAIASNLEKVKSKYNWKLIADAYEKLFHTALQQSQSAIQNKK
jgi:glycosyltransferase involved in cell wall biosynthesis